MGDAATCGQLDADTARAASQSPLEKEKTKFIYALYRWCDMDNKTDNKFKQRKAMFNAAMEMDKINCLERHVSGLKENLEEFLKLLCERDERAWLRVLLWVGGSHHLFDGFKEASPFKGKVIGVTSLDDLQEHDRMRLEMSSRLPHIDQLWPVTDRADSTFLGSMVIILPAGIEISIHRVM